MIVTILVAESSTSSKVLTLENLNPRVKSVEYAVRGEIAILADTLKNKLAQGAQLPFKEITNINIGNPQQLKQKPITFFRQVASLVENPELLSDENREKVEALYPKDTIERAKKLVASAGGSVGSYSHSMGIPYIREQVAKFIERRDGFSSDPDSIFLTAGASPAVQLVLQCMIDKPEVGVLIPIPQYPLYTASLALFNGQPVPYYLDEENAWGMNIADLKKSVDEARRNGTDVRALVIINPGNPTGQCLTEENMRDVIDFCQRERLVLCADEVYQTNIYVPEERPFHSFKKVLKSMGSSYENVELFSFHSISKGMIGECGRRGGYVECTGIDPKVIDQMYKISSISLCPNVQGQVMMELMVNPPQPGEPSYELYKNEMDDIYTSLIRRSTKLASAFNGLEGVTCNKAEGAMYLFPQIRLPAKAIEAAKAAGKQPDAFYSLEMLKETGVCVVPGSGFGQQEGTWHFRATFLPPEHTFDEFINLLENFHKKFMSTYRD
ncbi:PLP-dependent transferase [Basidiobolus meristosporus CBS 931.73]|uniref:Glutamate pyruvate transaminase n=1 Tax=Basidiobolus meristosporus CBS 931.73 TaxID=1314790 RepID=A0A1Y1XKA3_9FUNG|nr:PLP-dependent transferase [Basidiobolus meristosporus CBS 931.73]ORX92163.1 PLP-dependent transferase [Basidiobolus meristosporus CBS 931.73]|eukprot:ORX85886.1 PLP-dependent transferase [Basidiobolus meristosporus CBS 931.73]